MYLNKCILYGNLTKAPELKALPSGISVCGFSIATNRSYKDKNGAKQENVEYHNIVAFGKTAELINQYMTKGSPIYLEGRIQTRSWDDKEGKKNYRTEIVVESMQFGPKREGTTPTQSKFQKDTDELQGKAPMDGIEYPEGEVNVEDIPF